MAGGAPIRIVQETIPVFRGGQPKWSPDCSRIAFKEGINRWVLDVPTGRFNKVFSQRDKLPVPGCWSRDGREIYLWVRDTDRVHTAIRVVSATDKGGRILTTEKESSNRQYLDLSPDGSLLAVVWCEGRECDVWAMPAGGGRRVRITSHAGYDDGPAWSMDGERIAFVSTRSGNFDLWVVNVDGERIRRDLEMEE